MHWIRTLTLFLTLSPLAVSAAINPGGVVNAGSFMPFGLPNAGIAQGSLFLIFGSDLADPGLAQANEFPLPSTLGGASVQLVVSGVTVDCAMIFTTPGQVAALAPSNTPAGVGEIRLTYNGVVSTDSITVVETTVGIFAQSQAGSGPGIVQNFVDSANTPLNTLAAPGMPGQAIIIWATGLGGVAGDETGGALPGVRPAGLTVRVLIAGREAQVIDFGRSGCCAGLDQIVAVIPSDVDGCYLPLTVVTEKNGLTVSSNTVSIAVSSNGSACQDPSGLIPSQITSTGGRIRMGILSLGRGEGTLTIPGFGSGKSISDTASGSFFEMPEQAFTGAALPVQLPQIGACTVFSVLGREGDEPDTTPRPNAVMPLDAGASLTLNSPGGSRMLRRFDSELSIVYQDSAAETLELNGQPQPSTGALFLSPGTHTFVGPGGPDVGAFSASMTIPGIFDWTNSDVKTIPRSSQHTVFWSGAAPGSTVMISGSSTAPNGVGGSLTVTFNCFAESGAGSFSVPAYILQALPATGASVGVPLGTLNVLQIRTEAVEIPGIDIGLATYTVGELGAAVSYQ